MGLLGRGSNNVLRFVGVVLWSLGSGVEGVCNEDEHHPINGGYFIEGINGFSSELDTSISSNRKLHNSTWAQGISYPDGSKVFCTGMFCSDECREQGCPTFVVGHTCSMIRFCYEEDSGSDVWLMPNEMAMATCNFTDAEPVCNTTEGGGDDCCNFMVEEDADLKVYLFASKSGCEAGQRAAVTIDDFSGPGDACYGMGLTSSRIASCTCQYEGGVSTLSEPCHSQFVKGCLHHAPDNYQDLECCDTNTCVGKHKNYSHPIGLALEDDRKQLCRDDIPGRCLNSFEQTDDCCNRTCTTCGTDVSPYLSWAACDVGNGTAGSGECGYGGHGGRFSKYECDFTACPDEAPWAVNGERYRQWMRTVDEAGFMKSINIMEAVSVLGLNTLAKDIGMFEEELAGEGPYTLFAATDDAFVAAGDKADNIVVLYPLLENHIVEGIVVLDDMMSGENVTTLRNQTIVVKKDPATGTIHVNDALVADGPGYSLKNGHLYIIENMILDMPEDVIGACYDGKGLPDECGCPVDGCDKKQCEAEEGDWVQGGCPNLCDPVECQANLDKTEEPSVVPSGLPTGLPTGAPTDTPKEDPPKEDPPKEDPPKEDPPKEDPSDESSVEGLSLSFRVAVVSAIVASTLMH
jgi:uncharacterized surface protein with fasciclin (FAS1) repeats